MERQRDLTLFWVTKLGFLVNEGKSQLIPTQFPAFLGSTLDLINMLVFPSEKRVIRASRLASSLLARSPQPAKTWQKLLGHLSSLRELVPMAVTHTVYRVNIAHIKYCAQQVTALDAQFNYCALITSISSCVRGPRVCNLPGFLGRVVLLYSSRPAPLGMWQTQPVL